METPVKVSVCIKIDNQILTRTFENRNTLIFHCFSLDDLFVFDVHSFQYSSFIEMAERIGKVSICRFAACLLKHQIFQKSGLG